MYFALLMATRKIFSIYRDASKIFSEFIQAEEEEQAKQKPDK